jgi:hypothetical protein
MCDGQYQPSGVAEALTMLDRALDHLAAVDAASLPTSAQAEVLLALERAGRSTPPPAAGCWLPSQLRRAMRTTLTAAPAPG